MELNTSEYLDKHLPYRINSLLAYDLIEFRRSLSTYKDIKERCYQDSLILEPTFEISIVFGRALLQFLGIDYDQKNNSLKILKVKKGYNDVTINTLFSNREFCPLEEEIVVENKLALEVLIKLANKSVAHLTTTDSDDEEHHQLKRARMAIYKLMLKHVPEINKDKIWWYKQVELMQ